MSKEKAKKEAAEPMRRAATVKGKIAAIQEAASRIYSGVRAIQSNIGEQIKENQAYVKDFYG